MEYEDSNNSELDLLDLANAILTILSSSDKIENEEELFSDEFYIKVISSLLQDEEFQMESGKTSEEKINNLKGILDILSSNIGAELSEIDVKGIILKHDRESAKGLLELLLAIIQTIIKGHLEDIELDDNEEFKNHSLSENKLNLSEKKANDKMRLDKDEEIDLENLESLRLGKDKEKKKNSEKKENKNKSKEDKEEEEEEVKIEDNSKKNILNDEEDDSKEIKNLTDQKPKEFEDNILLDDEGYMKKSNNNKPTGNDNGDEDILKDSKEKKKEIDDILNNSNEININQITESEKKSSLKKSNEIPNLLDEDNSDFKKAKNQFEDIRILDQDNSDNLNNYSDQHQAYSVPQTQQKLQLPGASEENDLENDNDFDYNYNLDKKNKKEDSNITNSNINNSSQNKLNKSNNSKSGHQTTEKNKISKKNSSSKKHIESSNKKSTNKKDKIENENISKSKANESDKKNVENEEEGEVKGIQGGDPGEKNNVDGNQINPEQKISQTNEEDNGESPLYDEGFKYEIMKEFKRIYGDKLDNIFLKHNLENSRNTFELALRNIKLAKQKMMKIGNRIPEVDDLKTKEYIQRYERERQMMEINYNRDQKKLNFFEERAINNFKQNIKDMKKAKEIEAKKTESEIERRRKAQEVRNHHNQVKFCNEIYQRALILEKEKNLEKIKKKREINRKENEEKRLAMERIENYYKDQIRLLREILENEKKQKEIEHRAHIQFLSKLEKEKRNEYKKELDNIFDRFDQEEKKNEFERKNKKEINKIFEAYYGSK